MLKRVLTNCLFFVIALISIFALSFPNFCYSESNLISKEMALEIARKEAIPLEFNLKGKSESANIYSYAWNPHLPTKKDVIDLFESGELEPGEFKQLKRLNMLLSKLKNKTYWAITFSPKLIPNRITLDGTNVVFVDAKSGKVLDAYR